MSTKRDAVPADLDKVLTALAEHMQTLDKDSAQYNTAVEQYAKLYKLREVDSSRRVSKDTWATIAANLAGILIIVGYERLNVITSKAASFVRQLR